MAALSVVTLPRDISSVPVATPRTAPGSEATSRAPTNAARAPAALNPGARLICDSWKVGVDFVLVAKSVQFFF